jgi:tetratricopeptide (TPR) repeat protein
VFGGRERELGELKERLRQGETMAVTALQGLGGIGKTTLAYQAAFELYEEKVFGAVLSSSLTREPNALALLVDWAQYADPEFSVGDIPLRQLPLRVKALLEELLAEKCGGRTLVLLDDIWENGVGAARLLLEACPSGATVLMTSRSEGVVRSLKGRLYRLERLDEENGVRLLREYFKGEFEEADPALLREMSKTLGGHCLALALAARRILKRANRAKALEQHLAEYQKRLPALKEFEELKLDQGDQREDNLTLVLSYSYEDLSDEEKVRFRALGVLAYDQPFGTGMLAALWETGDEGEAEEYADELGLRALVQLDRETGEGWYRQHPLLQSYARALLIQGSEEYVVTLRRYQDYITGIVGQFDKLSPEKWGQLSSYLSHIQVVGDSLVHYVESESGLEDKALIECALAFAHNITPYIAHRREVPGECWLKMGLATSRSLQQQKLEGLFLNDLGTLYYDLGDQAKALEFYQQALPLQKAAGGHRAEATTLNNIGLVYRALGKKSNALECFQQALPLLRKIRDQRREATVFNNIGMIYDDLNDNDKALEYFQQALSIFRAVGDRYGEANTLNNIGGVYNNLDQHAQALEYFQQALSLFRLVEDRYGEAYILDNIGEVYKALGDQAKALDFFNQALPLRRAVGDRYGEAATLFGLGTLFYESGKLAQAITMVEQALELFQLVQSPDAEEAAEWLADRRIELNQQQDVG